MRTPTYEYLRRLSEEGTSIVFASGPLAPSGNPRHFKYFWQVFSMESPLEGGEFLLNAPALCTARFEAEVARLHALRMPCMVYSWRRPRKDPANPFDLNSEKWKNAEFAPAWDDDTDPIADGGHK